MSLWDCSNIRLILTKVLLVTFLGSSCGHRAVGWVGLTQHVAGLLGLSPVFQRVNVTLSTWTRIAAWLEISAGEMKQISMCLFLYLLF